MTTKLWHELNEKQAERLVGGWQRVTNVQIKDLGSLTRGIWDYDAYLTIDNKNHDVTTQTASGARGKFSWSYTEMPHAYNVANQAYINNKSVTLVYSEYNLFPTTDEDGKQPFYLLGIEFES